MGIDGWGKLLHIYWEAGEAYGDSLKRDHVLKWIGMKRFSSVFANARGYISPTLMPSVSVSNLLHLANNQQKYWQECFFEHYQNVIILIASNASFSGRYRHSPQHKRKWSITKTNTPSFDRIAFTFTHR